MGDFYIGDPSVLVFLMLTVATVLTVPLSLVLVRRYHAAVERSMRATSPTGGIDDAPTPRRRTDEGGPAVAIEHVSATTPISLSAAASQLLRHARSAPHRTSLVYGVAGAVHAVIATALLFALNDIEFLPVRFLSVWFLLAWPVVPTVMYAGVGSRRLKLLGPAAFVAIAYLISTVPIRDFVIVWIVYMGLPTLFLFVLNRRRWRGVVPMVFAATAVVTMGAIVVLSSTLSLLAAVGRVESTPVVCGVSIALLALVILAAWRILPFFARRYRAKKNSDQQFLIDAWWFLFTLWECVFFTLEAELLGFVGLLAFVAYKLVTAAGLAMIHARQRRHDPATLLLLRTFGSTDRAERLLDELGLQWRYVGSVHMIAGTDLAAAYLEPHELLDLVTGRLSRRFIVGSDDLAERLAELDLRPDPDGRFRVNDFFCHDDTWRAVLTELAQRSDAVLMDLRHFTASSRGCVYEIQQLVDLVPLDRVVLLADDTTDVSLLDETLRRATESISIDSPNRRRETIRVRVLELRRQNRRAMRKLVALLAGAATSVS